jgi:nucleoside-diphosphate-sugar epimerase
MRILVTGASGFVGSHLIPALLADDHDVVAALRRPGSAYCSAEVIVPDIAADTDWRAALEGVEVVLHLAARVHVMKEDSTDPLVEHRRINAAGTLALAEQAAACGVGRFVFLSTIKVNGEATHGQPYRDTDTPDPRTPYGVSKLEGERGLAKIAQRTGMAAIVLRAPVIYGSEVKGNIRRIIGLIRRGIPLPFGSIDNRRTMLSTGNLIEWVKAAVDSQQLPGLPVLMGDPRPVSTAELVVRLAQGMGRSPRLVKFPPGLLTRAGGLIGHGDDVARLLEDLEVAPSLDAFDRQLDLADPALELQELGSIEATGPLMVNLKG